MCRKRPKFAAWAAIGVVVSLAFAFQLALPGVVVASSLVPASLLTASPFLLIAGGDDDGDPHPPPPPPPPGVLWVDDFEDGSTEGWVVGQTSPFQPTNVPDGGPLGAGDNYLRLKSSGLADQPGGRIVVLNRNGLWTQDFNSRGVKAIEMDVLNLNSFFPMQLRFAFYTLGPNGFASKDPVTLVADGKWHHVVLPFIESAMTNLGTMSWADVLKQFEEVRILSSSVPGLRGDAIRADWGLDNIAVVVPEPSVAGLLAVGLACALLRRRRR
jgi:hypothetical protein